VVHCGFEIQQINPATAPAPIMRIAAWRSQRNIEGKYTKTRTSAPSVNRSRTVTFPGKWAGRVALPSLAHRGAILEHTVPMAFLSAFLVAFRGIPRFTAEPVEILRGRPASVAGVPVQPVEFGVRWVAVVGQAIGEAGKGRPAVLKKVFLDRRQVSIVTGVIPLAPQYR
jgi:hypothetical protein